jgi:glutamate dehydrogenase
VEWLQEAGVPADVARRQAYLPVLVHAPDIIDLAHTLSRPLTEVASVFFLLGQAVQLDRLERILHGVEVVSAWDRWAVQTLEDDLMSVRRLLAERVLVEAGARTPEDAVHHFLAERSHRVARLVRFTHTLEAEVLEDLAPLLVAVRQVRALAS